jgi:hypothetical protein
MPQGGGSNEAVTKPYHQKHAQPIAGGKCKACVCNKATQGRRRRECAKDAQQTLFTEHAPATQPWFLTHLARLDQRIFHNITSSVAFSY